MTGEPWDDLRFATLRRLFRGHLRLRQSLGRWDFVHNQLRETVRSWLAEIAVTPQQVHVSAAAHLLALQASDPVRHTETVFHLLEAEDWGGAARYLASVESDGLEGALETLVDALRTPTRSTREEFATRLTNLLRVPDLDDASLIRVADRLFDAHFRSQGRSSLAAERTILLALDEVVSGLVERNRGQLPLLKTHLKCLNFLGHALKDAGDLDLAVRVYERSARLAREIDSLQGTSESEPAGDPIPLGDALFARRDFAGALVYYRRAAAAGRSVGHGRVGVTLRMLGDFQGSLASLREDLTLLEQEVAANPRSAPLRFNLGLAYSTVASTIGEMNDYDGALESYRKAMDLMSPIAAQNPLDPHVQSQWAQMFLKVAVVRQKQGDPRAAVDLVARGRQIMNDVLAAHGDNPNYWRDVAMFDITWGDLSKDLGDRDAAVEYWRAAEEILQHLVAHDGSNAQWQQDLQVTRMRIEQGA
jgi:tetratricopeptide (TPR) repeat protein